MSSGDWQYSFPQVFNLTSGDDFFVASEVAPTAKSVIVNAGAGDDVVIGTLGNDFIFGGDGNDQLIGDAGNDFISGGAGDDMIAGNSGTDILSGGAGSDTFQYAFSLSQGSSGGDSHDGDHHYYYSRDDSGIRLSSADGNDVITDFQFGTDVLQFTDANFSGLSLTEQQFEDLFQLRQLDTNNDGVKDTTVLSLDDGGWSVTLIGVAGHTEADFYHEAVQFA